MVNFRQICRVGEGRLRHDVNGFRLTGCGGKLDFTQKPETSYSLYADYFWYELGDMICIGDRDVFYYCFPQGRAMWSPRRGSLPRSSTSSNAPKGPRKTADATVRCANPESFFLPATAECATMGDRKQKGERR